MKASLLAFLMVAVLAPGAARACTACYGQSDSPMAAGMNWGILSLLGIIVGVLVGVAGFFVYLAQRAARTPAVGPGGLGLTAARAPSEGM